MSRSGVSFKGDGVSAPSLAERSFSWIFLQFLTKCKQSFRNKFLKNNNNLVIYPILFDLCIKVNASPEIWHVKSFIHLGGWSRRNNTNSVIYCELWNLETTFSKEAAHALKMPFYGKNRILVDLEDNAWSSLPLLSIGIGCWRWHFKNVNRGLQQNPRSNFSTKYRSDIKGIKNFEGNTFWILFKM